jgi:hypothetical protein
MDYVNLRPYGISYAGPFLGVKYVSDGFLPQATLLEDSGAQELHIMCGNLYKRRIITPREVAFSGSHGLVEVVEVLEVCEDIGEDSDASELQVLFQKSSKDGESLSCEAFFQVAARSVLAEYGLEGAIAEICDIFRDARTGRGVFTMVPFQNIQLFSDLLASCEMTEADVISVLGQVGVLLWILGERLDMNHRDLKTNNVILCAGEGLEVAWADRLVCVGGRWSVKLVDFGFACAGSGRRTLVNATGFFPITDPCPKTGRDLFQLLTVMYMCEPFRSGMSAKLRGLFKKWLTIPGRDYIQFLENMGERGLDWVYFLLGSQSFSAPTCEPAAVLADLTAAYPEIVRA